MPLLKNLISIPERVPQGDFVLQLTRGVSEPEQTPRDYVGTPQKVDAFNNALGFIQQAVQTASSKAAHLYGSFGSGGGAARPTPRTVSARAFFGGFDAEEARALGFTSDELPGWKPVAAPARRGRQRASRTGVLSGRAGLGRSSHEEADCRSCKPGHLALVPDREGEVAKNRVQCRSL